MSAHFARTNHHEALDRLADRRLLRALAYVDGHWTASEAAASFEVTDPASRSHHCLR
ncbi:MAG: NAD-dependent succinate-semialdehyde dehydrogenase, partial [Mesorhizobium sp.]